MRVAAISFLLAVAVARSAWAFEDFEGTRAQGMGGATRAWALGDSAPLLNPSGMSLAKVYNAEASYGYTSRLSGQFLHASVVDSTSASTLAGGLYYTYRTDRSVTGVLGHGHEAGAAISLPIGPHLIAGATLKWFHLAGPDQGPEAVSGGVTFDGGITVRALPQLSFAVVGVNINDLHTGQAPRMLTYGAAFLPFPNLVLAADGVTAFSRDDVTGARGTGFRGGGELTLFQRVTVRAGGGLDPLLGVGYLAAGLGALSDVGAIDVGVRGDLWSVDKTYGALNLFLGLSLRLFVGSAIPEENGDRQNGDRQPYFNE
jgi:hypothetical protein